MTEPLEELDRLGSAQGMLPREVVLQVDALLEVSGRKALVLDGGNLNKSWVNMAASKVARLIEDASTLWEKEWEIVKDKYKKSMIDEERRALLRQAEAHGNVRTY